MLIPRYDVEGACRRSGLDVRACIKAEQRDYEGARRMWPELSEKAREDCAKSFRTAGERRYASFAGCVYARAINENHARRLSSSPPSFRY